MIFSEDIQEVDSVQIGQRMQEVRRQKGIKTLDMAVLLDIKYYIKQRNIWKYLLITSCMEEKKMRI